MKKILRTILILVWLLPCVCFSQEYVFKNFDTQQGLPSSEVYDCFQDAKGKIWFLTDRGLSQYDGYSFQNFSTKDGLLDNTLLNYYKTSDSLVWISSLNNQLVALNTTKGTFEPYIYNTKIKDFLLESGIRNVNFNNFTVSPDNSLFAGLTMIKKIEIDRNGNFNSQKIVKFTSRDHTIHYYISPEGKTKAYKSTKYDTLSLKNSLYLSQESKFSTRYKAMHINKKLIVISDRDSLFLYKNNVCVTKKANGSRILNIGKFYNNQFWVSYIGNGVDVFDDNGLFVKHFLVKKSVTSLLIDHNQSIWATTLNSGVYYCKNPNLNFHRTSAVNHIHSLAVKNDTLYAGTYDGIIFKYRNRKFVPVYNSTKNLPIILSKNNTVNDLIFYDLKGAYSFSNKDLITINYIRGFSDSANDLLYAYGGVSTLYKMEDGKITSTMITQSEKLKTLMTLDLQPFEDKLLVATNEGLFANITNETSIFDGRVNDIDRFKSDFAIATAEKGVVLFKDYKPILSITEKNGLYSNQITEILVENDSIIWACSNVGVNRIEIVNNEIILISGLSHSEDLGIEVKDIQIVKDTLWIGTKKGLYSYPTKKIKRANKEVLQYFTLEKISVNNQERSKQYLKQLSYDENAIFIQYSCIAFNNSANLEYRYKFKGNDWVYTKNREIRLTNVPAINTNFIIQAREGSAAWVSENQLILPIHITPAFWTTWWFKSLLVFAIGLLIYFFFKIRVLTYNKDIIRGLLMSLFNRVKTEKLAITIKSDGKHIKLFSSDILYIQSSGNYIEIFTVEKSYVTRETIKSFHKELPDKINYLQIHRSYLVRLDKICAHNYTSVTIHELSIPIGKTYQKEVHKILLK